MSEDVEQEPQHRGSRLVLLLPLAVFGVLAAAFYWGLWNNDERLPSTLIGKQVPEFALPPIEGRHDGLSSADLQGRVSLVNVWASWCVPCRTENPLLVELAEAGTVPIYGINYKDPPEQARAWLDELGDPYARIGADIDGRAGIEWGVYGVPETFLLDADGTILLRHAGPIDRRVLEDILLPRIRGLQ